MPAPAVEGPGAPRVGLRIGSACPPTGLVWSHSNNSLINENYLQFFSGLLQSALCFHLFSRTLTYPTCSFNHEWMDGGGSSRRKRNCATWSSKIHDSLSHIAMNNSAYIYI